MEYSAMARDGGYHLPIRVVYGMNTCNMLIDAPMLNLVNI